MFGWLKKFGTFSPPSTASPRLFIQELMKPLEIYDYKLHSCLMIWYSFISVFLFHCTYHMFPLIVVAGISCGALHCHSKHHPWQVRGSTHSSHCYSPLWSLRKHQSERYSHGPLLTTCLIMKKHGSRVDMKRDQFASHMNASWAERRKLIPDLPSGATHEVKQQGRSCSDWLAYEQMAQSNRIHISKSSRAVHRVHVNYDMPVNTEQETMEILKRKGLSHTACDLTNQWKELAWAFSEREDIHDPSDGWTAPVDPSVPWRMSSLKSLNVDSRAFSLWRFIKWHQTYN